MGIDNIKTTITELWDEISLSWHDEMAQKYKRIVLYEVEETLSEIRTVSIELQNVSDESMRKIQKIKELL